MSEWWAYRPSDFLMFSPRAYARLFELTNQALWPLPWLLPAAALLWCGWAASRRLGARAVRSGAALLALAWAVCGWFFVHQRYAAINWAADWLALAFGAQAAAFGMLAAAGRAPGEGGTGTRLSRRTAAVLGVWGLVGQPLLGWAGGRSWMQCEWFGVAPDATVVATLGFMLWAGSRWWLWLLPLAAALASAATLATMGSAAAMVPLLAALVASGAARQTRKSRR